MSSMPSQTYRVVAAPVAAPAEGCGAATDGATARSSAGSTTNRSTTCRTNRGCLKFVLISYGDAVSRQISYTYWPALVFPTYVSLQVFLRDNSGGGTLAQVKREWKGQVDASTRYGTGSVDGGPISFPGYEVIMQGWKTQGFFVPNERTDQLCLLIGTSLPPGVTRSWPILPSRQMPPHLRAARMAPAAPFTNEWCNNFRRRKEGDLTFLSALEMAERCNVNGIDALAPMLSCTSPTDVFNGGGAMTTSMPAEQQSQQRLASNHMAAPAQDYAVPAAYAHNAPSPDDDDDVPVYNVDKNGAYNIPTPSKNNPTPRTGSSWNRRPMETSKTALREVAVEGAARAAARMGKGAGKVGGGVPPDIDEGVAGEFGGDDEVRTSPHKPKRIDFSTVARDMAEAYVSGGISNDSSSDSGGSSSKKHVSFGPETVNHTVDASMATTLASKSSAADTAADKSAPLATPKAATAETTTSSTGGGSKKAAKATRRATPSPSQSDGGVATAAAAQDFEIAQEERYRRLREKIPPDLEWPLVWPTLKLHGWVHKNGQGLISYYYCCSKYADEKVSYMLKHAVRGDEYFCNDDELKTFCRDKLGWTGGEGGNQESTSKDTEKDESACRPKRASRQVVTKSSATGVSMAAASTIKPVSRARAKAALAKSKTSGDNSAEDEIVCDNSRSGGSESSDSNFCRVELSPSTRRQRKNLIDTAMGTGPGGALCSPESFASVYDPSEAAGVASGANSPPTKKKRNTIRNKKPQATKAKKAPATKSKKSSEAKTKKTTVATGKKKAVQPTKSNRRARKPQTEMMSRDNTPARVPVPGPTSPDAATPASSKKSPNDPEKIFSDAEAWRVILMRRFKFKYRGGFYCLPGVDPRSEDAIEGRDYFRLLTKLRRHLCAFGVPLDGITGKKRTNGKSRRSRVDAIDNIDVMALLGYEDYRALNLWVRYAVVQSLRLVNVVPSDVNRIPEKSFMRKGGAWELLQKLGYRYSAGSYKLPHSPGDRAVSFDRAQDLCRHLARFGLTSSEAGTLISSEQLKLELFIAECSNVDTFEWIEPQDGDYHWLTQSALDFSKPVAKTSSAAQAGAGMASPSSMKTTGIQAAEKSDENGARIDETSHQATPLLPTEITLSTPLSDTSALSATPMTSFSTNDISEIDDSAAREAAEAVRLERNSLTEDVNAVARASGSDARRLGNEDDDGDDDDFARPLELCREGSHPLSGSNHSIIDRNLLNFENEDEKQLQGPATALTSVEPDDLAEEEADILMDDEGSSDCQRTLTEPADTAAETRKRKASSEPAKPAAKPREAKLAVNNSTEAIPRPNTRNDHSSSDLSQADDRKRKARQIETDMSTSNKKTQKRPSARSPDSPTSTNEGSPAKQSLPDTKRTVVEKLRSCQSVLHSDEVEDMFTNSPRVKKHVEAIRSFLERAMTAYGRGKGRFYPSSLYICGGPGTGKTTSLNMCIETCDLSKDHSDARFLFRNVVSCGADGPSQAKRLLEDIKTKLRCSGEVSYAKIEKALSCPPTKERRVAPFVLVLDEIDMLLSGGVRSDGKLVGGNKLIHTMLRWAADPNCAFSLIGVSNAIDDDRTRTLNALGDLHKILTFRPYKEEDLISILTARVGTQIIAEPALKMVSRKVAAGSGDARKALDMAAKAVRKCETDLSEEDLQKSNDEISYPIVKLPHMMRSIREGMGMRHAESIAALPQAAKIVLCVAVALSTVSPAWKVIKMRDLKKYCTEASRHGLMERLNIDNLFDTVQMLSDSGLLLSGDGMDVRYAVYGMDVHEVPLMLGVQLDDVEMALEKTLLTEQFYKSMVEYVKKHHRHPS